MRDVHKTSMKDPAAKAIVKASFPDYRGRNIKYVVTDQPQSFTTWWDGNTKDDLTAVRLSTMEVAELPPSDPFDERGATMAIYHKGLAPIPDIAIVCQSIFCGKVSGISIYLHPDNAPRMLAAASEMGRHRG